MRNAIPYSFFIYDVCVLRPPNSAPPNRLSTCRYCALLHACIGSRDAAKTLQVLGEMEDRRLVPEASALLGALALCRCAACFLAPLLAQPLHAGFNGCGQEFYGSWYEATRVCGSCTRIPT